MARSQKGASGHPISLIALTAAKQPLKFLRIARHEIFLRGTEEIAPGAPWVGDTKVGSTVLGCINPTAMRADHLPTNQLLEERNLLQLLAKPNVQAFRAQGALRFEAIAIRIGAEPQGRRASAAPGFYRPMCTFAMKNSRQDICTQRVGDMGFEWAFVEHSKTRRGSIFTGPRLRHIPLMCI